MITTYECLYSIALAPIAGLTAGFDALTGSDGGPGRLLRAQSGPLNLISGRQQRGHADLTQAAGPPYIANLVERPSKP